ncbi:LacI family DNA-binding transcriptional regulator [Dactylosporangium siamense]|uniref:LacI family transcriptional regulator n=2 Tax=Dactylosporangium siamense TaxID=685454 RepID=A0A919PJI8_9ACTN|nr:LacI family transcriptional regulator [Dactylosporangium siamense]
MTVRRMDVARLAGTSPAVVSYVLNNGPRPVSTETRAKVLAAIEQLGYRPNGIARSLRMSRTMTLGLVVPDNANPYFAELARAVEEESFAQGYTLLIGNAAESDDRQTSYVRTFLARQVDGLFIVPAHGPAGFLPELQRSQTPWVSLDRQVPGAAAPGVLVDNRGGAYAATRHLIGHGRGRVACIGGPEDVLPAHDRVSGWRDALDEEGVSRRDMSVVHSEFGRRAGYRAARELLARPDRPDAVFVASDEQAVGVLRAIGEAGLRCPDDVAVASFDGIPGAAYSTPALTTMAQPFAAIGRAAMTHLLAQQAGTAGPTDVLPVVLVRRGSCGCDDPPGGDETAVAEPNEGEQA